MTKNINKMMCLDLYLSSLNEEELKAVDFENNVETFQTMPLLSWDIYSDYRLSQLKELQRNQDILYVKALAQKFNWIVDIDELFKEESFEAIVLTDLNQKIIWVNDGFREMTGYFRKEVLHRTPGFLQGPKTSLEVKERIRIKLSGTAAFKEVIVNYKKNKEDYKCEVKIFPLYNEKTTHFIALENRVI